jgi:hypothetical protein
VVASSTSATASTKVFSVATSSITIVGNGTCVIEGNTACSSDQRLKTNIASIPGSTALNGLALISGVTYNWADPTWEQRQQVGVIAQNVLQAFPQLVGSAPITFDGQSGSYYTVDYAGLTAPLISGVNQLNGVFNATNASTSAPSILSLYQGRAPAITIDQFGDLSIGTSTATTTTHQLLCLNGSCITGFPFATSTSSPSPSFASDFLAALKQILVGWLGDATNGIDQFFANVGNFHTVNTNRLCVGTTCVTPAQFQAMVAAANQSATAPASSSPSSSTATDTPDSTASTSSGQASSPQAPIIQINGDNPAIVQVGTTYNDLGATITGPQADINLGIKTFLNGALVSNIVLDTSAAATDTIDYAVTDSQGLTSTSTRTVIIETSQSFSITTAASTTTPSATTTQS